MSRKRSAAATGPAYVAVVGLNYRAPSGQGEVRVEPGERCPADMPASAAEAYLRKGAIRTVAVAVVAEAEATEEPAETPAEE